MYIICNGSCKSDVLILCHFYNLWWQVVNVTEKNVYFVNWLVLCIVIINSMNLVVPQFQCGKGSIITMTECHVFKDWQETNNYLSRFRFAEVNTNVPEEQQNHGRLAAAHCYRENIFLSYFLSSYGENMFGGNWTPASCRRRERNSKYLSFPRNLIPLLGVYARAGLPGNFPWKPIRPGVGEINE